MNNNVIEGEVIDMETGPGLDPHIAAELEDFQQRMDQMKDVYRFAADHISHGHYRPQPSPRASQGPRRGYFAVRRCGNALVKAGNWLLDKCPTIEDPLSSHDEAGVKWGWSHETGIKRPATLPPPHLGRYGGS